MSFIGNHANYQILQRRCKYRPYPTISILNENENKLIFKNILISIDWFYFYYCYILYSNEINICKWFLKHILNNNLILKY